MPERGMDRRKKDVYLWDTFPGQVIFVQRRDITFE